MTAIILRLRPRSAAEIQTARQQLVAAMAEHIISIDCVGNDCDAFRALMHSDRYDIAVASLCFADAMYLAQQIVFAGEMCGS